MAKEPEKSLEEPKKEASKDPEGGIEKPIEKVSPVKKALGSAGTFLTRLTQSLKKKTPPEKDPSPSNVIDLSEAKEARASSNERKPKKGVKKVAGSVTSLLFLPKTFINLMKYGDTSSKLLALGLLFGVALISGTAIKLIQSFSQKIISITPEQQEQLTSVKNKLRTQDLKIQELVEAQFGGYEENRRADLGTLTIIVQSEQNPDVHSADLSISILCDTPESCTFYKKQLPIVHDAIITELDSIPFELLLTQQGRNEVKEKIRTALYRLGRLKSVEEIYFKALLGS